MKRLALTVATTVLVLLGCFSAAGSAEHEAAGKNGGKVVLSFFWGEGCPHCARAKPFLAELQRRYPALVVRDYEVMEHRENLPLLEEMAKRHGVEATGVPMIFVGHRAIAGFSKEKGAEVEAAVQGELAERATAGGATAGTGSSIDLPLIGRLEGGSISLPLFTFIIAGADSFNPCAFFVLFFLLSLLVHARSRSRMLLIGGTFVLCSGVVYFLFMAAWLNLFLLIGQLTAVTVAAGVIAVVIALINIKDFFLFHKGVSLTIPDEAKPKLFARMRALLRASALPAMLTGTVVLALAANSYELLCTAGFPMVYTRVLTLNPLSPLQHYLYLALYNGIYMVPLAVIVALFVVTLGGRKLTEWQGRILKLISGTMMLSLGTMLLTAPHLLNNALASIALLIVAMAVAGVVIFVTKRVRPDLVRN
ncbi:thioredoxin family protein [Geobacter sp. AOG1]|uniref:glutaredoxin family protein n=1 Tax=Geobacter sp. AOG1 TaxID=1566346 RepID=UPI001CC5B256|nr:thioredoxin family protein [Geobacter sp. AOG1]GFE57543.1 membrane protein [Geobacter sp. AOG1]